MLQKYFDNTTIITLAVTIIVLAILAGVAISAAVGENGVIPATAAVDSANMWYGFYAYQKVMASKNGYTNSPASLISFFDFLRHN